MNRLFFISSIAILVLLGCEIEQTREGEAPDVDIDVEADSGRVPKYDVDWMSVDVRTRKDTIEVPTLVVVREKREVEVPYLDFDMPGEEDDELEYEERTLQVEVELEEEMHELEIVEVYATGNRLYVISELESTGDPVGEESVRVSDRVVINAPEDLDVRYYVIGDKPNGDFNRSYRFINDRNDIANRLSGGKQVYAL